MARSPRLTSKQIWKIITPRLKRFDKSPVLERYAMFMGKAQILEFGLKRLLVDDREYEYEEVENKSLGFTIGELRKTGIRLDFLVLLEDVLKYRNYFAHEFLADQALVGFILKKKGVGFSKPVRELSKAYFAIEQAIQVHDFLRAHGLVWSKNISKAKHLKKQTYLDIYNAANANARQLLESGNLLYDAELYGPAYALGFSALEEISKGQYAADVFTGLKTEREFSAFYKNHVEKIDHIEWAHKDSNKHPYNINYLSPHWDDFEVISPNQPVFEKRNGGLFVDVDLKRGTLSTPGETVTEKDARDILHIVKVALERIWEITGEFGGMQIGTKGFMK